MYKNFIFKRSQYKKQYDFFKHHSLSIKLTRTFFNCQFLSKKLKTKAYFNEKGLAPGILMLCLPALFDLLVVVLGLSDLLEVEVPELVYILKGMASFFFLTGFEVAGLAGFSGSFWCAGRGFAMSKLADNCWPSDSAWVGKYQLKCFCNLISVKHAQEIFE